MRLSDKWQDYCLIDTSDGERLERWGDVTLIRPDPQIIWKCSGEAPEWRTAHAKYNRSSSGGGSWDYRRKLPESWQIKYGELTFMVKPTGFKHTGLFPEQAVNWDYCMNAIRGADRPINVLNLFAYTGGATLACAAAGASVCHVDAVKGMVDWARTNAKLSGLSDKPIRWIVDDAQKFISREIRRLPAIRQRYPARSVSPYNSVRRAANSRRPSSGPLPKNSTPPTARSHRILRRVTDFFLTPEFITQARANKSRQKSLV